jgi:hypothetical protein
MNDLNDLLCAHPHTKCTKTKKNRDGTKKYEYQKCCCRCSYRITLTHECYFHVKKACKDKLRGNSEKGVILQDIGELHTILTKAEFDTKFSAMFNCWLVSRWWEKYCAEEWQVGGNDISISIKRVWVWSSCVWGTAQRGKWEMKE